MSVDMQLDFFEYDEKFMQVIDALFYINFGQSGSDLISYYLYERINEDGSINPIIDKNGTEVYIETPYQLWNVLNDMKVHDQ
jgi:hypothetical protein